MAYDQDLADRIRAALGARDNLAEKQMFGGLAFLVNGNLAVAASGQGGLIVRCDPATTDDHLDNGADPMIMRGRPVSGWLRVSDEHIAADSELRRWVSLGTAHAAGLPPK